MVITSKPRAGLQGRRILVVEVEYMIAAETISPDTTVGDAMLLTTDHDIGAIPNAYGRLHSCEKPTGWTDLAIAVTRAMTETPCR